MIIYTCSFLNSMILASVQTGYRMNLLFAYE